MSVQVQPSISSPVNQHLSKVAIGNDVSTLAEIYHDAINIAIWQREHQQALDIYAQHWTQQKLTYSMRVILSADKAEEVLQNQLPVFDNKNYFLQDVLFLVDMFACLFDVKEIGLRLTPLNKAMCPKFHVDNIPCRLVTTYGGLGTEWLREDNVNRNDLGKETTDLTDDQSSVISDKRAIQQLSSQYVSLLKGSGWEGNEKSGLVHRSPRLSEGQTRLLLTMDFS